MDDIYDDLLADVRARYGSGKDVFEQRKERIDREHAEATERAHAEIQADEQARERRASFRLV